jgi:hypothetical protein
MIHSQFNVLYYPKRDKPYNIAAWETTPVDLYAYLDFNCQETTANKQDGSNLPFIKKVFYTGNGTYTSATRVYTFTGPNWATDKWKWHTLIDANDNRYVILSNTANTITLASTTYFNFYGTPITGNCRIELPDFEDDDIFVINGWKITDGVYTEPATFADKILFVGQVISRSVKNDNRGVQVNLKLGNMTELLLKVTKKWDLSVDTGFGTVPEKINQVLAEVNGMNAGTIQVTLDAPATLSTGAAWPDVDYSVDDTSAADVIYELLKPEYTQDVCEYYAYLKPVSESEFSLVIRPKIITTSTELIEGRDFDFISFKNDKSETISSIIFNCGKDCKGHNTRQIIYGDFKKGNRTKRITKNICTAIINKEIQENPSDFDTDTDYFPTSYPYTTFTEVTIDEVNAVKNSPSYSAVISTTGAYTLGSDNEYNKWVRILAKARATLLGRAYIRKNNKARDQITVRFYSTPASLIPGSTNKLSIYTLGWTGGAVGQRDYRKDLRIANKNVGVDNNGIFVEATYLEDEELAR